MSYIEAEMLGLDLTWKLCKLLYPEYFDVVDYEAVEEILGSAFDEVGKQLGMPVCFSKLIQNQGDAQ